MGPHLHIAGRHILLPWRRKARDLAGTIMVNGIRVWKNPTQKRIDALTASVPEGHLRAIKGGGNLFVWAAIEAIHWQMKRWLVDENELGYGLPVKELEFYGKPGGDPLKKRKDDAVAVEKMVFGKPAHDASASFWLNGTEVLADPTLAEMRAQAVGSRYGSVRWMKVGGITYTWRADKAVHVHVWQQLQALGKAEKDIPLWVANPPYGETKLAAPSTTAVFHAGEYPSSPMPVRYANPVIAKHLMGDSTGAFWAAETEVVQNPTTTEIEHLAAEDPNRTVRWVRHKGNKWYWCASYLHHQQVWWMLHDRGLVPREERIPDGTGEKRYDNIRPLARFHTPQSEQAWDATDSTAAFYINGHEVLKNPTVREIAEIIRNDSYHEARWVQLDNDKWYFPAGPVMHYEVFTELYKQGLDPKNRKIMRKGAVRFVKGKLTEDSTGAFYVGNTEILQNPSDPEIRKLAREDAFNSLRWLAYGGKVWFWLGGRGPLHWRVHEYLMQNGTIPFDAPVKSGITEIPLGAKPGIAGRLMAGAHDATAAFYIKGHEVLIDPSEHEIKKLAQQSRYEASVRWMKLDGVKYVWLAEALGHGDVWLELLHRYPEVKKTVNFERGATNFPELSKAGRLRAGAAVDATAAFYVKGHEVLVNPSTSEIRKMALADEHREVRWLKFGKDTYYFPATTVLHDDVMQWLEKTKGIWGMRNIKQGVQGLRRGVLEDLPRWAE